MLTATRTASSSRPLSPQLAMGKASNQSPLCGAPEAIFIYLFIYLLVQH